MDIYSYLKAVNSPDGPADTRVREVCTQLALHRNRKTGKCNPGTRRLAEQSTMARNTVKAKLDAAEALGWIRRTQRERGGESGALTQYELTIPEQPKRVSQSDPHSVGDSGSARVTRSPDSKRVNFEGQAGQFSDQAGQHGRPSGSARVTPNRGTVPKQVEQLRACAREPATGLSTGTAERQQRISGGVDSDRIRRAAQSVAEPGYVDRWIAWIEEHPEERVELAEGLRHHVTTGQSGWPRGKLFTPGVFENTPGLRAEARSAYLRMIDAEVPRTAQLEEAV